MAHNPDPARERPALHLLPEDDDQAVVDALRAAGAAQHDRLGGPGNEDSGSLPASGPAGEGRYEDRASIMVTPTLFLKSAPPAVSGPWTYAQTAEEAVMAIKAGGRAVLPAGAWDEADKVLIAFGATPEHRRHQLHWARTKEII